MLNKKCVQMNGRVNFFLATAYLLIFIKSVVLYSAALYGQEKDFY